MVEAFSLTSESLRYFIGYALLRGREVYIVSPWISDVSLRFPINDQLDRRQATLLDALDELDADVTLVVQAGQDHNEYIEQRLPEDVSLIAVEDLHAKLVVTAEFVYLGSANITRGGLSLNREVCEILENEYPDSRTYLEAELDLELPDSG